MLWSSFEAWLSAVPPWAVGAVLFAAALLALALGRVISARLAPVQGETDAFLLSSVLGLLALLLGFSFALAIDRYETRRVLVQQEANAINTAYTRAQLLEEPHRTRVRGLLFEYTENRIALASARPGRNRELLARNDRLLGDFWSASAAAFPSIRQLDFSSTFIESVNDVINMDATRKSARIARLPTEVFVLLMIYVVASAGVLGMVGRGKHVLGLSALFLALLTLSLMLILDIDRPTTGGVREAQGPMERLFATMWASNPR
jgi:hypothetical protein